MGKMNSKTFSENHSEVEKNRSNWKTLELSWAEIKNYPFSIIFIKLKFIYSKSSLANKRIPIITWHWMKVRATNFNWIFHWKLFRDWKILYGSCFGFILSFVSFFYFFFCFVLNTSSRKIFLFNIHSTHVAGIMDGGKEKKSLSHIKTNGEKTASMNYYHPKTICHKLNTKQPSAMMLCWFFFLSSCIICAGHLFGCFEMLTTLSSVAIERFVIC